MIGDEGDEVTATLEEMIAEVHKAMDEGRLPPEHMPMSREQIVSFVWGNLECSTNHRVPREEVERIVDEWMAERGRR